jgi:hypothetical protein
MLKRSLKFFLFALMLFGIAMMFGCGSDGSNGADGASAYDVAVANGFNGSEAEWLASLKGDSGEEIATIESCNVCHGGGADRDVAVVHTENAAAMSDGTLIAEITDITNDGAGNLTVFFSVVDGDGVGVAGLGGDILLGDLVPGAESGWDSTYAQEWEWFYGAPVINDLTGGDYSYNVVANMATLEADDADHPYFSTAHTKRVVIEVQGDGYKPATIVQDFDLTGGVADGSPILVDPVAVKAPAEGCKTCHGEMMVGGAAQTHGGRTVPFADTRACVLCHSPAPLGYSGDNMLNDSAYLARFIHARVIIKSCV